MDKKTFDEINENARKDGLMKTLNIYAELEGIKPNTYASHYFTFKKKLKEREAIPAPESNEDSRGARTFQIYTGEEKRRVFSLHNEGKSVKEIADIVNRTEKGIISLLYRAEKSAAKTNEIAPKETRMPLEEYLKRYNVNTLETTTETATTPATSTLLVRGTEIRIPVSVRLENNELIITIQ